MYDVFEALCKQNNVTPYAVGKATGIRTGTLTNWKKGRYTPKADKMKLIADYFGVSVEYLTTGKAEPKDSLGGTTYYFDDDTAQTAQDIMDNPMLRALFKAARDSRPEDLKMATDLLERVKGTDG